MRMSVNMFILNTLIQIVRIIARFAIDMQHGGTVRSCNILIEEIESVKRQLN